MNKGITHYPEIGLMPNQHVSIANYLCIHSSVCDITIETASEYIIRQLQLNVVRKKLDPKTVEIWYHYNEIDLETGDLLIPEGERKDYKIEILDDGSLSRNFGSGFFDVSGNQDLLLYQLNRKG
jgi:hypothetical protein